MNRRDRLAQINALPHIKARWEGFAGEFRVTYRGLKADREEAHAYYTDDGEDAYDTAVRMEQKQSEWRN